MKRKISVLFVLFLLAIFGSRLAFYISQKLHIDFTQINMDLDDEIL